MAIERYSLLDTVNRMYNEHLVQGSTTEHPNIPGPTVSSSPQEDLEEGCKSTKSTARFSVNQKTYVDDKFEIGQRRTKNAEGTRRFTVDEFLTPPQFQSYFSRTAKKNKEL